jgi:four helix bundle protein
MHLGADIAERLLELGVIAIRLCAQLPKDRASHHVGLQLVRAATAAGANYEEARAAESRADFVHKLAVAAKEMREACYWINLVRRSGWVSADLSSLLHEAHEVAAILGASVRTARVRAQADRNDR